MGALMARVGSHLEDAWDYRPWIRRDVSFEDVGGWYLYAITEANEAGPSMPLSPRPPATWTGGGR